MLSEIVVEGDDNNRRLVGILGVVLGNEWTAYADATVAEDNPEYPDESPIVVVAFYDDLAEHAEELLWPESPVPLIQLSDYGVKDYAFPVDRLQPADDTSLVERHAGTDQETTEISDETETTSDTDELDDGEPDTTPEDDEESNANDDENQDLHELRNYLKDNGVRSEISEETVVVEKLGETYRLSTDEVVEGDGPYQDRLEQLVDEAPV